MIKARYAGCYSSNVPRPMHQSVCDSFAKRLERNSIGLDALHPFDTLITVVACKHSHRPVHPLNCGYICRRLAIQDHILGITKTYAVDARKIILIRQNRRSVGIAIFAEQAKRAHNIRR